MPNSAIWILCSEHVRIEFVLRSTPKLFGILIDFVDVSVWQLSVKTKSYIYYSLEPLPGFSGAQRIIKRTRILNQIKIKWIRLSFMKPTEIHFTLSIKIFRLIDPTWTNFDCTDNSTNRDVNLFKVLSEIPYIKRYNL